MGFARENTVEGPTEIRRESVNVCNGCKHHDEEGFHLEYRALCRHPEASIEPPGGLGVKAMYDVRGPLRVIGANNGTMTRTPGWCPYLLAREKKA